MSASDSIEKRKHPLKREGIIIVIITNTIRVRSNYREVMLKQLRSSFTEEQMIDVQGFQGVEVIFREIPEEEQVSEVIVMSRWESEENQEAWKKSDSFKLLHRRSKDFSKADERYENPVLGNSVKRYYTE